MPTEPNVYYFCRPTSAHPDGVAAGPPVAFVTALEFLADEPACKMLWELVDTQFRTRGKFFAIWRAVAYVAIHRDGDGAVDGFLLVSAFVNWQVDYVVVRPDARGQGVAAALVRTAVAEAFRHNVPYVMLTSKASLRPLYEACGFEVVRPAQPAAVSPTA